MTEQSLDRAATLEMPDDIDAINRLYRERRWGDGLPIVPPTAARVERMLAHSRRSRHELVARVAPGFGAATVERIAINAVMAGCDPEYLPVLIAATEAIADAEFNLQGIQATTNPVAVWLVLNGPVVQQLQVNAGFNCIGQGHWANATLGRALRLILRNDRLIGGLWLRLRAISVAPERHVARAMRRYHVAAVNDAVNLLYWKHSAVALGDHGEVRRRSFEELTNRTVTKSG